MMRGDFDWGAVLTATVIGLAVCVFLDGIQIARLQADVAFLRDLARNTDALRSDHD